MTRALTRVEFRKRQGRKSSSLELDLERMYCELTARPAQLFVTSSGRVVKARDVQKYTRVEEMGSFTKAIELADLRAEAFAAWERLGKQ